MKSAPLVASFLSALDLASQVSATTVPQVEGPFQSSNALTTLPLGIATAPAGPSDVVDRMVPTAVPQAGNFIQPPNEPVSLPPDAPIFEYMSFDMENTSAPIDVVNWWYTHKTCKPDYFRMTPEHVEESKVVDWYESFVRPLWCKMI